MPTKDGLIDGPTNVPNPKQTTPPKFGAQGSADSSHPDLGQSYLFYVKIDGTVVAIFSECSGLGARREVTDSFFEGGVNEYKHILPGRLEFDHITLKRGLTTSKDLWNWFEAGKYNFNVPRRSISILQEAHDVGVIKTWNIVRAFPVSWKLSGLDSSSSSLVVETLELAHEGLTLA